MGNDLQELFVQQDGCDCKEATNQRSPHLQQTPFHPKDTFGSVQLLDSI
jgi:hypothetical protein